MIPRQVPTRFPGTLEVEPNGFSRRQKNHPPFRRQLPHQVQPPAMHLKRRGENRLYVGIAGIGDLYMDHPTDLRDDHIERRTGVNKRICSQFTGQKTCHVNYFRLAMSYGSSHQSPRCGNTSGLPWEHCHFATSQLGKVRQPEHSHSIPLASPTDHGPSVSIWRTALCGRGASHET